MSQENNYYITLFPYNCMSMEFSFIKMTPHGCSFSKLKFFQKAILEPFL